MCCGSELPGSSDKHTNTVQVPGLGTAAAITWLSFTVGRARSWERGLSPRWGCVIRASTKALIIALYLSLQIFCALTGCVGHCGAVLMLVGR